MYQPDTLTSKLLMKKVRKLWRRALKKANNPDDNVSDPGSFRLGELARIARRQQLEEEELNRTRKEAENIENEKKRLAEEKLKDEEKSATLTKTTILPGFLGGGGGFRPNGVEQLQTDMRIIERKVDDVISMIERFIRNKKISPIDLANNGDNEISMTQPKVVRKPLKAKKKPKSSKMKPFLP